MSAYRFLLPCWLLGSTIALGQEDRPQVYVAKTPATQLERDRRASLDQYVLGLLYERDDRLLAALEAFEIAGKLDPEAVAVFKAQVPLLLALDRIIDAQTAVRKVLALDPGDHQTWFLAARLHKTLGQSKDARQAMIRGLECPDLKEHPEIAHEMYADLASLFEAADEITPALAAYGEAAKLLEHPQAILENSNASRAALLAMSAEIHEKIGRLLTRQEKYPEAIAAYKKAQTRNPDGGARLNFNLAHLSAALGRMDQALTYLDAYLRLRPLGLEAYEMKLGLLKRLNKQDAIIPWLDQAVQDDRFNVGLKQMLAEQYRLARQFSQAQKIYQNLMEEAPAPEVYLGLFRLHRDDPKAGMAQVLALVNKTMEEANQKPSPPPGAASRGRAMIAALRDDASLAKDLIHVGFERLPREKLLRPETVHFLAVLAEKHQKLKEAETFYRHCLDDSARKPPLATETGIHSGYFRVLYKARKYQEMLDLCARGLREEGAKQAKAANTLLFYHEQAKAFARLGKMEEALQAADQALDQANDQNRLVFQQLRIRLLTQAQQFAKAEKECLALLREHTNPSDGLDIRYLLSNVYAAAKQMAKSEEQLEFILKLDPDYAPANNDLGYIWADQGKNLKEAEVLVRRALEDDRRARKDKSRADDHDNAAYVDSLGWVLFRQGKMEEAKIELERAARLPNGDDPVIHDHLGDVYFRLKQLAAARAAWRKSAEIHELENSRGQNERHQEVLRKLKRVEAELQGP